MNLKVVESLPAADDNDKRSAIDVLERALADARAGNVMAVAVALVGPGRKVGYISSESARHATQLLASVDLMHWRILQGVWTNLNVDTEIFPDPPA